MEKYKLIIFDCDGTLVDSESLSNRLISNMMNEIGIPMTEEKSLKLFKGTHFGFITQYIISNCKSNITFDFEKEFRKRCQALFENELRTVDGVETFIQNLKVPFCVASNGPREKMNISLRVTGLDKYFDTRNTFSAYDFNKFKPDPTMFLKAAEKYKVAAGDCLVIEDTLPGIEAAIKAKMDVWAVHHPGINNEVLDLNIKTFRTFKTMHIS